VAITRLDFAVPEFTQIIWVSPEARSVWEERIARISRTWIEFERLAVSQEMKPLALQSCDPRELPNLMRLMSDVGLTVYPLKMEGAASSSYGNAARPVIEGEAWTYRIVIGYEDHVFEFLNAWDHRNDKKIGEALGYPSCCQEFFYQNWVISGWRDTTYPMVRDAFGESNHYQVNGPAACNILLRWLGVRMVSHLPCNFQCEATAQMANGLMDEFKKLYPEEFNWLNQILQWSIRWDSLHGIAIISTPVLKIVTSTDPLSDRVVIDREGMIYPAEGASGVQFPFRVINPIRFYKSEEETNYTDNGFMSRSAMEKGHALILEMVNNLEEAPGIIIDLGCGNAALLQKVGEIYPRAQLVGVEIDTERCNRAAKRLISGKILNSGISNLLPIVSGDLIMISVNRLLEMDEELRQDFFNSAGPDVKYILVYSYAGTNLISSELGWLSNYDKYRHFVSGPNEAILLKRQTVNVGN
jgi:hypothetical protein